MTTLEREPIQLLGYLEGRIEEQSAAIHEIKDGQQQILARFDRMQTFLVNRMDEAEARVTNRIDRVFMALAGLATGIIVTQFGVIVTLLLR